MTTSAYASRLNLVIRLNELGIDWVIIERRGLQTRRGFWNSPTS